MVLIDGQTPLLAGLLIGLAGAGHCAGMCGGLLAMLSLRTRAALPAGPAVGLAALPGLVGLSLVLMQLGRVLAYIALGALAGGVLTLPLGTLGLAEADPHQGLQALAALSLALVGLKALGVPLERALPLRIRSTAGCGLSRVAERLDPAGHPLQALGVGIAWGLIPCPMVWATLLYAGLQGSALWGGAVMAGFGLGTLAVMVPMALGMPWLMAWARRPQMRRAGGALLLGLAAASLVVTEAWTLVC